jgi:D-lactate dehydrogenase
MSSLVPRRRLISLARRRSRLLQNRLSSSSVKKEETVMVGNNTSDSWSRYQHAVPIALVSLSIGFLAGRQSTRDSNEEALVLPNGLPRTCCDSQELTEQQKALWKTLKRIVGRANVLDGTVEDTQTSQFLKGARLGRGTALYIVRPKKLRQLIEIVRETVEADCVVLVQGQNTGLTGGSVPRRQDDNRPTVIVSMKDLDTIIPIDDGRRVVCLGGVGLASLQNFIQGTFGRESHSTLGSTFLNPTTAAGVSLGSGGTQCRKGPAYTERALYLKVDKDKYGKAVVKVVNTLGVKGLDNEEGEFVAHLRHDGLIRLMDSYVDKVRGGYESRMKKSNDTYGKAPASDVDYKTRLCNHDHQVSRFNADTSGCDCNRSEGKVLVLASVHDTYEPPKASKTFWVSFDSLETALEFRREVCLDNPQDVPISVEYMDRDAFDVIDSAGRVLGNMIKLVGPSSTIVRDLWNIKLWIEALDFTGAPMVIDKFLYFVNPILPSILPSSVLKLGKNLDHHVAMTIGDFDGSLDRVTKRLEDFCKKQGKKVAVHECRSKSEQASFDCISFCGRSSLSDMVCWRRCAGY